MVHNCIFSETHIFVLIVEVIVIHDVVRIADPLPNGARLHKSTWQKLTFVRQQYNTKQFFFIYSILFPQLLS